MREHHLRAVTKLPAKAQDNLIIKLEGTTMWIEMLVRIPRAMRFKDFIIPDDDGNVGGGVGGVGN